MASGSRVLPWRRHQAATSHELAPLLAAYKRRHPKGSVSPINRAYDMSREAHRHQTRTTGESYITHPVAVASVVADIGLDEASIIAALLHDAVEDTELTLAEISEIFGDEVASIVDGVTKLDRLQFDSQEAQQAATMRKMLVAMARDLRVLIIKLADRLHNMRTLASSSPDKQQRVAQETLDIYAPLAHRLGMQEIKQQLEDLSFAALFPKRYAEVEHLVSTRAPERNVYLARVLGQVDKMLVGVKIKAELTSRGKHLWSIYEKMVQKGREFDDIFDLMAIRIVVDDVRDCYGALGVIHGHWKPVVGRFKDYIAMPKFNLYQSLHTTVIGPDGKTIEVQIRSRDMHQRAEWGVASHWAYKDAATPQEVEWLNRIIDWQGEVSDPRQFLEGLKTDLEQDELFVFTPKGRVVSLPLQSTPVDFAYAVHTEVGHSCVGARVNGRLVALSYQLASGDTCEILTSKAQGTGPSQGWMEFVASTKAKNKIKQWWTREQLEDMVDEGHDEFVEELRRVGLSMRRMEGSPELAAEVAALGYGDLNGLLAAVGQKKVPARALVARLVEALRAPDSSGELAAMPAMRTRSSAARTKNSVYVEGLDDILVRLSKCCTPVPGDDIMGFITRGRGVTVHRVDCANALSLMSEQSARIIDVEWAGLSADDTFVAAVEVVALDRTRLLRDVANALSDQRVNIVSCTTQTGSDRVAKMRFEFEFSDPNHLQAMLRIIKNIDGVYDAYRLLPGAPDTADIGSSHPSAN
ncbi:MAG: bifunctional (p)ppGpp synthetase/guanosine-3',5'-bis(diphosphate) 3'-pyrophosphohydrolase [Ilumatobacteraceae bacterium]|jgi:GTP diphosphokinase / guanosine-3',5'-bis(diphosphate) 3'-diphosphatase|nr:bifunctional (p)ppGpp synthetase/guanosine-3',5'-bis(diphosphate) 3'-pyrophosphohydrolase [Ilumatobacteraceae bacterium]